MNTCWSKKIIKLGWLLIMVVSMSACSKSWQEEVQLHDGSKIIVERTVDRGGRHEIGQNSPIKRQSLEFVLPTTKESVVWTTEYSADVGFTDFAPILLNVVRGQVYIVTVPMGCLSYNKWGRPNPPYVVFQYEEKTWKRILLTDLPAEITTPNLIISSPDEEAASVGKMLISVEDIRKLNGRPVQLEFKAILREPIETKWAIGSSVNCENLVSYKGKWVLPNDPVAREMIDRWSK